MKNLVKKFVGGAAFALPLLSLAASVNSIEGGLSVVIDLINRWIIPLIIGLAIVYFLIGVLNYLMGDEEKKERGKHIMIYGAIAIFVMVSIWGLVNVLGGTFGFSNNYGPSQGLPQVPR